MYKLGVNNNKDIMVMKVVMDDMPPALKLKKVKEEAEDDPTYQEVKRTKQAGKKSKNSDLSLYAHLLKELTVVGKLVLRGDRIVVPDSVPGEGNGTLRQGCLELGHEGHQAAPPHKVAVARHRKARRNQGGICIVPKLHTNKPQEPPATHHGGLRTDGTPER